MRVCPVCRLAYRLGDPGSTAVVPPNNKHSAKPGEYQCCTECAAHYRPEAPHLASLWFQIDAGFQSAGPTHGDLTRAIEDGDMSSPTWGICPYAPAGLCGMCKRFARENDQMQAMRLYAEDFDSLEEAAKVIPPQDLAEGMSKSVCYMVCHDCREKWKPKILERLIRQKVVPATMPLMAMGPQMLA